MLDAFDRLPFETEEEFVARSEAERVKDGGADAHGGIGVWGSGPMDGVGNSMNPSDFWRHQHVMAVSVLMAPLAAAQASTLAVRRARKLGKKWNEALARCTNMEQLIDVNRAFGEQAIELGAGEMWRFVERASVMGRATASPESLQERNAVDQR